VEGQILGLADRINSIVDMFAIGLKPTGSKDPFALRRAASGVVKILAESQLPITLGGLTKIAVQASIQPGARETSAEVKAFLRERLDFYLRETRGLSYDVVAASLAAGGDDIPDAIARAEALTAVRGSDDFAAISAAFKRIKNILRQAAEKERASPDDIAGAVDEALLTEPAEKTLWAESTRLSSVVEALRGERKYREALEKIASLRPHVDGFFDAVMVMAPEPEIRKNRLALIASVLREFSKIADFSEIVAS
jgi:glycyl-tRNA synthetase beta chain